MNYLESLKEYILEQYPEVFYHDASHTDSSYFFIDEVKIRLSDHIQCNMSNKDLYLVKAAGNDDMFVVFMQHCKNPYIMNFDEVKLFIKHFLIFRQANELSKKGEETSAEIKQAINKNKENIENIKKVEVKNIEDKKLEIKKVEVKNTQQDSPDVKKATTIRDDVKKEKSQIDITLFNDPGYINKFWKAFEKIHLINMIPWYGYLEKSDLRRNIVCAIVSKCASGGLSYKDTIALIEKKQSINDLKELQDEIREKYDTPKQRSERYHEKYVTLENRLNNWDEFNGLFEKAFSWFGDLADTNKNIIRNIYKTNTASTHILDKNLLEIYEQFDNMKWRACSAFKARIKDLKC